ncbi:MAG: hypothetical protein KDN20_25145 [Verrucomicrobiae bacterium]|nr:hypothetical protein [Verrucomicrobiae bacterium]
MSEISFRKCNPRPWNGRYTRVTGGSSWRLKTISGRWWPIIDWRSDDYQLTCPSLESPASVALAEAVSGGKKSLGGSGGGSFLINEFGQVIVPSSSGDGKRVIVGELTGELIYENPMASGPHDQTFRLGDASGLNPGDPWSLPYVGAQYNLNKWSKIYHYRLNADGGKSEFPDEQDEDLVRMLRNIRRSGAVRILVNPAGIVLTKRPPAGDWGAEETWEAVYVGRISHSKWFTKED